MVDTGNAGPVEADVDVIEEELPSLSKTTVITQEKFGYLFGKASGAAHNIARAAQNAIQMAKVGVYNDPGGQSLLRSHFESVVTDASSIVGSFSNQYGNFQMRESLFAGPGGFLKFVSTWEVLANGQSRFVTAIPY